MEYYNLNFDISTAPREIQEAIENGQFYELKNGEYIRNMEKEEQIEKENEIAVLQEEVQLLRQLDDETLINILIFLLKSNIYPQDISEIEKESFKTILDKLDLAKEKEISINEKTDIDSSNYQEWEANTEYKQGQRIIYEGNIYELIQDHYSIINWTPNLVWNIYKFIKAVSDDFKPFEEGKSYKIGSKVIYNTKKYECVLGDGAGFNHWLPTEYGWIEIA